jgi:hypothetical protein
MRIELLEEPDDWTDEDSGWCATLTSTSFFENARSVAAAGACYRLVNVYERACDE